MPIEEIRQLLRANQALLIHFNTPMSNHEHGYPRDLHEALANPQWEMCYSTIMPNDVGPTAPGPRVPNAVGSVGILVDLAHDTNLIRVCYTDAGSDGRVYGPGFGEEPSLEACERTLHDRPDGHNEWYLSRPAALGIFMFPFPAVFNKGIGEQNIELHQILSDFPDQRVFSAHGCQFYEFDRPSEKWLERAYDDIVPIITTQ